MKQTADSTGKHKAPGGLSLWKIFLPVVIGVTVVFLMMRHDARQENLSQILSSIHLDARVISSIVIAVLCILGRDFGLTWRFRSLTDKKLTWKQAWKVDMLCEFTSCVTPSAVGGSSLGMIFLNTEGIEIGKATTLMLTTLFMDELFFVVACPIVILLTPANEIFISGETAFAYGLKYTFWTVYAVIAIWTFILFAGIIWKPYWIQKLLDRISGWRLLRKWGDKLRGLGGNMVATSKELRMKPFHFWLEIFGGTALSWTSRYLVVNVLFFGFMPADDRYQWLIFARQLVIWVVLMICPTPGGAGLSEWLFSEYYGDIISTAGMAIVMAVMWRLVTYYLYLLIGAVVVPVWLRSSYARFHSNQSSGSVSPNVSNAPSDQPPSI